MGKKRKKAKWNGEDFEIKSISSGETSDYEFSDCDDNNTDKYEPYKVYDCSRRYPEDSAVGGEFIVFVASINQEQPMSRHDVPQQLLFAVC